MQGSCLTVELQNVVVTRKAAGCQDAEQGKPQCTAKFRDDAHPEANLDTVGRSLPTQMQHPDAVGAYPAHQFPRVPAFGSLSGNARGAAGGLTRTCSECGGHAWFIAWLAPFIHRYSMRRSTVKRCMQQLNGLAVWHRLPQQPWLSLLLLAQAGASGNGSRPRHQQRGTECVLCLHETTEGIVRTKACACD
jgi:hypothetical protein